MSRESSSHAPQPPAAASSSEPASREESSAEQVTEDSNNNTSLVDRERHGGTEGGSEAAEASGTQHSPAVREIHKNSWLKKMPCVDKWSGKFPKTQKLEKFWVVFCVHDDKEAFLEFYENRRSAYSHMPLSSVSLAKCLHISPTIVAQGNDHEFVITLESQVIRLAASTNEQMLEWMDTLSTKLRELGVLEPKDNLYSKEPIMSKPPTQSSLESQAREDFIRLSLRDPNSPLPPVPAPPPLPPDPPPSSAPSSTVVYIRNPPSSSTTTDNSRTQTTVFNFDVEPTTPAEPPAEQRIQSVPNTPSTEQSSLYEPLFCAASPTVGMGVRNPNYENPPRHIVFKPTPALPPRDIRRTSLSSNPSVDTRSGSNLGNLTSASDPSLHASASSSPQASEPISASPVALLRTHSHVEPSSSAPDRSAHPLMGDRPLNIMRAQSSSAFKNGTIPVDENGRPISLREAQVQKLQSEILHKSGVRLILRKKDCLNAIAFVECFNCVWVAGWKQKEHPLLHNTFHVGDRVLSIAGHRIMCVQDALKAVKQQTATVEFIVRRVSYGKVLAIKREYEGQDLGIVREGGTAEIKEVKSSGLAARQGLPSKAPSLDGSSFCNWVLTEINHRPLNLFFKDNEVLDRLNAVGLDISLLVQPADLVKALKKQLKALRSYKDYIVQ